MATHLLGWTESVDSASLGRLTAIQDDVVTLSGVDRFVIPPEYNYIKWAAALGSDITRAQIVTPSIERARQTLEIVPRVQGDDAFNLGISGIMVMERPTMLDVAEEIEVRASEDKANASRMYAFVSIGTQALPPVPDGPLMHVRGVGTTTLVANAWSTVTITLDNALPVGVYALVDFFGVSATGIVCRALPQGGGYRPGTAVAAGAEKVAVESVQAFYKPTGGYRMFDFPQNNIPQFQFLASAADTAETVFMRLIKIS